MKSRVANLDALRAFAILLVVVYHTAQIFNNAFPDFWRFAQAGILGVDLFFALSGYLVGSLYFIERKANNKVQTLRFILRRTLRTIPPYFIVLIISFAAVEIRRHQDFDYGYLVFIQNFYDQVPFFLISWSLCVEEHFYLALPFVLSFYFLFDKKPSIKLAILLFALTLLPLWLRFGYQYLDQVHDRNSFGYYKTATHLRIDTLIFGVLFAYLTVHFQQTIQFLIRFRYVIYPTTIMLLLSYSYWPTEWMYSIGRYLIGLCFATTVAIASKDESWAISKLSIISTIAVCSYAIYLTHVLVRHFVIGIIIQTSLSNLVLMACLIIVITLLVGYVFYLLVEKPIMNFRNRLVPSPSSKYKL